MSPFGPRQLFIAALIYLVVSLVCTQIPLLNYLGYEFSLLIAFLGSVISGLLTIRLIKVELAKPRATSREVTHQSVVMFGQTVLINLTLLLIPLVVMLTNSLFVKNCSLVEGSSFFILLPVVSVWFASSLGFLCVACCRFSKAMFFLFLAASLVYSLALGYFTPAIYSFNFFYGYFPGLTYDEALGVSWTLLIFRVLTVLVGVLLVWMAVLIVSNTATADPMLVKGITLLKQLSQPKRRLLSAATVVVLVFVYLYRGSLGFESPSAFIQQELGERFETDNFTIFYSKDSYSDQEMHWIGEEHEFRLHQILDALNLPFHDRIESYIYPSDEAKQRLIGTSTTNIAKPWSSQIHITERTLDRALKHELVHVLAAPAGLPVIKSGISPGLVEGLAMAIEWDWGNRTLHQYAAGMHKFGVALDIQHLMKFAGFTTQSSSVSYVLAGSFCRFLIDSYGIWKIMLLYRSGDYDRLYGQSLEMLIVEWQRFLDQIPIDQRDSGVTDAFFRRPPIFQKVCARVLAERNTEARKSLAQKNYASAAQLYWESYTEGKAYSALSGYLVCELRQQRYSSLIVALDTIIMKQQHPGAFLPLFLNIGDAFWGEKKFSEALDLYSRVTYADLSESHTGAAIIRSIALKDPMIRDALFEYFVSDADDTLRLAMLDSISQASPRNWIPIYLKGKMLYHLKQFDDSFRLLSSVSLAEMNKHLEAIRLKTVSKALFRMWRFQEAKASSWLSLNFVTTEVAMNEVNDWIERCEWFGRRTLP